MGNWQWVIGPADGGHEFALTEARNRRVTWRLTSPSEASFEIDGRHFEAGQITELATDLHVIRDQRILYRGRIGTTGDVLDANEHRTSVSAIDYREVLNRRLFWTGATLTFDAVDQAQIMVDLLANTQVQDGGDINAFVSPSTTGVTRDRTYEVGDTIGQRMQELSEVINGFDWDIHPLDDTSPATLVLEIYYPQRGEDRGVILEYDSSLIQGLTREIDPSDYANAVYVTGDEAATTPPTPVELEAANVASRPEGRWDKAYGTTIVRQTTLQERAEWQLDDAQALVPSYKVTLTHDAWGGPSHIWLGDTVRLVIRSGRLDTDVKLRVTEITAVLDENNEESVTLTIGRPKTELYREVPLILRRIADLERR